MNQPGKENLNKLARSLGVPTWEQFLYEQWLAGRFEDLSQVQIIARESDEYLTWAAALSIVATEFYESHQYIPRPT